MLETVTAYLEKALKTKQTGSAVSPLLWMNAIVSVPLLLCSAWLSPPMNIAFFVLAAGIVLFSLWEYRRLVRIDPRFVQSEKLQFELAKLDFVAAKGSAVIIDPVNIEFSSETTLLASSSGSEEA